MTERSIILAGLSYRTAAVDVRERFALTAHTDPETWAVPLCPKHSEHAEHPANIPNTELNETLILSTCNRVEILAVGSGDVPSLVLQSWAQARGESVSALIPHAYVHTGDAAVRHLFAVAASLDSMVLGEPQILGQLKDAYRKATVARTTGTMINRLLHKAFSVAKRVRTETEVASSAVSISFAAVELAKRIFGDMSGRKAMLVGAGEMAELAATHLLQSGVRDLLVVNRTYANAKELAARFNGEPLELSALLSRLPEVDIVISSTGSPDTVLHAPQVREVLALRKNRPMFFIDIAVPRDIDPAVNNLDNVYLYDIDDLREVVEENMSHRQDEARKAHRLVDEEVADFRRWQHSLALQPTIVDLVRRLEGVGSDELAKTLKRLGPVDDATREALTALVQGIVRKLGHDPLMFLKAAHDRGDTAQIDLARALFNLDDRRESSRSASRCPYRHVRHDIC